MNRYLIPFYGEELLGTELPEVAQLACKSLNVESSLPRPHAPDLCAAENPSQMHLTHIV